MILRQFIQARFKNRYLILLLGISIICYLSILVPPTVFWPAVFASYAIPVLLVFHGFLMLLFLFWRRNLLIFPIMALLIGLPFIHNTISIEGTDEPKNHSFSMLGFNAKLFRQYKIYNEFSKDMIKWAANDNSDIKCFQEYSTNHLSEDLNVTKQIAEKGYNHFVFSAKMDPDVAYNNPGLAIFTKFDILDSGVVWQDYGSFNAGIFADIRIGKDVIRIYNIHLASMRLELYRYKDTHNYYRKIIRLLLRLKHGAEKRSSQIDLLINHAKNSPYPVIICGDFNETPYSYNYFKLKRHFSNSFEQAGNGFGFSYHSILFFLRIDHQFYTEKIKAIDYRVDRKMRISDHFPIRSRYSINEDND